MEPLLLDYYLVDVASNFPGRLETVPWWEDFAVGETVDMGSHRFTAEEIIAFARPFDPQPFHTDPEAAARSPFGSLIASGWHTCAIGMRLMVERAIGRTASLGSPGVASRPGVGLVRHRWEAQNLHGELVFSMEGWGMFGRKPAA